MTDCIIPEQRELIENVILCNVKTHLKVQYSHRAPSWRSIKAEKQTGSELHVSDLLESESEFALLASLCADSEL